MYNRLCFVLPLNPSWLNGLECKPFSNIFLNNNKLGQRMKGWKVFRGKKMRIGKWRRALKIWRRRHLTLLLQNVAPYQKYARKTPPKTPEKQQKGRLFRKKRKKCRRILANRILLSNFANSKKHRYPVAVASRPAAPTGGRMRYAPTDWQLR